MKRRKIGLFELKKGIAILLTVAMLCTLLPSYGYFGVDRVYADEPAEGLQPYTDVDGNYVYQSDYLDFVAIVEGGAENDVSGTSNLYISTEKPVTIRMKEGVQKTDQSIICNAGAVNDSFNLTLDNICIDRSGQKVEFNSSDFVSDYEPQMAAIYGGKSWQSTQGSMTAKGNLHITLKGENTVIGPSAVTETGGLVQDKDGNWVQFDGTHRTYGIYAVNLAVSGDGSLNTSSGDYGLYAYYNLKIVSGKIHADGGYMEMGYEYSSEVSGGSFPADAYYKADSGRQYIYGLTVSRDSYADPATGEAIQAYEADLSGSGDYPVTVKHTAEAESYLSGLYGRTELSKKSRGADYVSAYDAALADVYAFKGGSSFSASYGLDYGFSTAAYDPTNSESEMIMYAIYNDNPQFFWWWPSAHSTGSGGFSVNLADGVSQATLESRGEEFVRAADECLYQAGISDEMKDSEKAYALYRVLIGKVTYNIDYIDQTAYAALVKNTAVCAGYAKAYTYLLQKAGIQASYVPGYATAGQESGGHAWVLAKLDGAYYYMDPTLDDGGTVPRFKFFMVSYTTLVKDHTFDDQGYEFPTEGTDGELPADLITLSATGDGVTVFPSSVILPKGSAAAVTILTEGDVLPSSALVNGTAAEITKIRDGMYQVYLKNLTANTAVTITSKEQIETKLSLELPDVYVGDSGYEMMEGSAFLVKVGLKRKNGSTGIEGGQVSLSISKAGAASAVLSKSITTTEDGFASWMITETEAAALTEGSYVIRAEYAGSGSILPAKAEDISFTVLSASSYDLEEAGLTLSPTLGGTLGPSDYYYDGAKDVLTIMSTRPITIRMAEGKTSSKTQIVVKKGLASADLTLDGVAIDRSSVIATKTSETAALLNESRIDPENDTTEENQIATELSLHLTGSNTLIGASYFDTESYTMEAGGSTDRVLAYGLRAGGTLAIDGSGDLTVVGGFSNSEELKDKTDTNGDSMLSYSAASYGIFAENLEITDASVTSHSESAGSAVGAGCSAYSSTLAMNGGKLITSAGDGLGGFCISTGTNYKTITVSEGAVLDASAGKVGESFPDYSKGIDGSICTVYDGTLNAVGGGIGYSGFRFSVYNGFISLDGQTPLKMSSASYPPIFNGGYYSVGDETDGTIFGFAVGENYTVGKETVDGKTWYRLAECYPLTVSGGRSGVDYKWNDYHGLLQLKILTNTPLTLSMNPDRKEGLQCYIETASDLNANLTLDGVSIDRGGFVSSTSISESGNSMDAVIYAYGSDVTLNLKGENTFIAAAPGTSSSWGIRCRNLTICGDGTLSLKGTDAESTSYTYLIETAEDITVEGGETKLTCNTIGTSAGAEYAISCNGSFSQKNGSVVVKGTDTEINSKILWPVNINKDLSISGGSMDVTGGNTVDYPSYGMYITGNMTMTGGTLNVRKVSSSSSEACSISVKGNLKVTDGEIVSVTGDGEGKNYGIMVKGNAVISGGKIRTESGKTGPGNRFGMDVLSDFTMTAGTVEAVGGDKKDGSLTDGTDDMSFGLFVQNSFTISGGTLTATGGTALSSFGVLQASSNGNCHIKGGTVKVYGGAADGSFGIGVYGYGNFSGGTLLAKAGAGKTFSFGIASTAMEMILSGSTIESVGSTVSSDGSAELSMSGGLYAGLSAQQTNGSVKITGGTMKFTGDTAKESDGIYVYDTLTISGGNLELIGKTKGMDAHKYVITGGAFAKGDVSAQTVYGVKPSSGYSVSAGGTAPYTYLIGKAGHTHQLVRVAAKAATTKTTGNKAYYKCSGCGKYFSDQAGKNEITNKSSVILAKLPTGWKTSGTKKMYYDASGKIVKGWKTIGKKKYYFDAKGIMQTGWKTISKKKYYFDTKGVMQTGLKTIKKKKYYFNAKGVMQTGWVKIGKKKYYFTAKGVMKTGWLRLKGKWYYLDAKGVMVTGTKKIGGKKYKFTSKGVCKNR